MDGEKSDGEAGGADAGVKAIKGEKEGMEDTPKGLRVRGVTPSSPRSQGVCLSFHATLLSNLCLHLAPSLAQRWEVWFSPVLPPGGGELRGRNGTQQPAAQLTPHSQPSSSPSCLTRCAKARQWLGAEGEWESASRDTETPQPALLELRDRGSNLYLSAGREGNSKQCHTSPRLWGTPAERRRPRQGTRLRSQTRT